MDITKMLTFARNHPLRPLLPSKTFSEKEQLAGQYVLVIYYLGQLMGSIQANQVALQAYCNALQAFLQIANERKWTYKMLVDDELLAQIEQKWASQSLNTVYLILEQQLNKSYFENNQAAFVHAWHIFLKFGLVDLGFTAGEIEAQYLQA